MRRRSCGWVLGAAALLLGTGAPAVAQANVASLLEAAAMARAKGSDSAAVTVFEIADFQCPYCAQFARDVFPAIDSAFVKTGRVQWVFVNLPLPMHSKAWGAAEAAMCAGAAGNRFWAMHDRLYAKQEEWSELDDARPTFASMARQVGADFGQWERCVANDLVAPLIVQDLMGASGASITGTPTFIVNRDQKIVGVKSFEEWKDVIERAETRAKSAGS